MKRPSSTLRRVVKIAAIMLAGIAAIVLAIAAYLAWPRSYPRTYLGTSAAAIEQARPLASLATDARFRLGAAVHDSEVETFSSAAGRDFNSMTPANALKWGSLLVGGRLGAYDFGAADELVNLALAKQTRVRGHNLVWGRFVGHGFPSDLEAKLQAAVDPKLELERILTEHIQTVLAHFKGRIAQWDVVNEPLDLRAPAWDDNILYRTLGPEFVAKSFQIAHAADPALELVLNEQLGLYDDEHAEKFLDILRQLRATGVPIHGVGLQSHVLVTIPSIASIEAYMRRIAELGLFIELTELDVRVRLFSDSPDPYAAQGEFFRELASVCLKQPACRGITVWGISDRFSWLDEFAPFSWLRPNDPLLFDRDMRRKPAYLGLAEALGQAPAARKALP